MSKINKIRCGVIPAGGRSQRMGYLSNLLPKSLFPIYDKPILHYVISQMENVGIEKIFIILNFNKEQIKEYINLVRGNFKSEIFLIEEKEARGIGGALLNVEKKLNEPFMVILGDDFTIVDSLDGLVKEFFRKKPIVIEGIVREKDEKVLKQTCCAKLDREGKIIEILEKPAKPPYKLRGCGVYVFDPKIFHYIKRTKKDKTKKQLGITETINMVAKNGLAYGYIFNGYNVNINNYDDLMKASLLLKKAAKTKKQSLC